ncbi:KilA-N domain-containing protein [Caproiciproducens galactitolivorans]|uniref:KilA-N domain-containing protein n=1 Tax=Caproiciproducens galactitolivorans TaxID=642589 RepID=A0ABT4BY40_9FIRM|nr:KilA-N domain-containing protein [Caproiciproducens galactitolivorans]MCY1715240.1 KilA-N domain-containing protein [Caproiciproducens galactitolivorans]
MSEQLMIPGFIDRKAENEIISQRVTDGYINATAMCKAAGKQMRDYNRSIATKPFLDELSKATGVPTSNLVLTISGGVPQLQGTWVHPQVAVNLAQWLSPKFAVLVSQWVAEWMSGGARSTNLPYHLRRYMANMNNVPYGYFSMLNEVTLHLIGPLEALGYTVSSSQIPDISLGRTFSKHLRDEGYPVDGYPKYPHHYEDGRVVQARAYPNKLIGELRKFFVETWLKDRSVQYFTERDPKALPYLREFLALPNYREAMGYLEDKVDK